MALHEHFREYTREEIVEIKQKVCLKHKCPYLQKINDYLGKGTGPSNNICNYIGKTGHMRGCMPDECKHWKDKNVPKRDSKAFTHDDGTNNDYIFRKETF